MFLNLFWKGGNSLTVRPPVHEGPGVKSLRGLVEEKIAFAQQEGPDHLSLGRIIKYSLGGCRCVRQLNKRFHTLSQGAGWWNGRGV